MPDPNKDIRNRAIELRLEDLSFEVIVGTHTPLENVEHFALDQIHLVFSPHKSKADAIYVVEQINQLLVLSKGAPLTLWHELGCPIHFPLTVNDIEAEEKKLAMHDRLPTVDWQRELDSGTLSRHALEVLQQIHRNSKRNQVPILKKLFTPGIDLSSVVLTDNPEWLEYYREVTRISSAHQFVNHKVESPPFEALVQMVLGKHQQQKLQSIILSGDYESSVLTIAHEAHHSGNYQAMRDQALAQEIAVALRKDGPQLHICIRGTQHRVRLYSALASNDAKVGSLLSSISWKVAGEFDNPIPERITTSKQLSHSEKDQIFSLLFANLIQPFLECNPSVGAILSEIAAQLPGEHLREVFEDALHKPWQSTQLLSKHIMKWFLNHGSVKNDTRLTQFNPIRLA